MGCNVAEGKVGEEFLLKVGENFIGSNGGFVGGTTVAQWFFCIPIINLPVTEANIWPWQKDQLKIVRVDKSGKATLVQ